MSFLSFKVKKGFPTGSAVQYDKCSNELQAFHTVTYLAYTIITVQAKEKQSKKLNRMLCEDKKNRHKWTKSRWEFQSTFGVPTNYSRRRKKTSAQEFGEKKNFPGISMFAHDRGRRPFFGSMCQSEKRKHLSSFLSLSSRQLVGMHEKEWTSSSVLRYLAHGKTHTTLIVSPVDQRKSEKLEFSTSQRDVVVCLVHVCEHETDDNEDVFSSSLLRSLNLKNTYLTRKKSTGSRTLLQFRLFLFSFGSSSCYRTTRGMRAVWLLRLKEEKNNWRLLCSSCLLLDIDKISLNRWHVQIDEGHGSITTETYSEIGPWSSFHRTRELTEGDEDEEEDRKKRGQYIFFVVFCFFSPDSLMAVSLGLPTLVSLLFLLPQRKHAHRHTDTHQQQEQRQWRRQFHISELVRREPMKNLKEQIITGKQTDK